MFYSKFAIDIKESISQKFSSHCLLNNRKIFHKIKLIPNINFQQIHFSTKYNIANTDLLGP